MILDTVENELQYTSSEALPEMAFGIKEQDVSHIILLLRQKMYRFPIEAICREVACNARDANREVGKGDVPIRINIGINPFLQDASCLAIEDDGPGISPSRMADVFINYGASTKRDTNEQTGGFGLGAKTPFAYTNQFLIETCSNGVKYTYMAMITQGNRGRMVLMHQEEYFGEAPFGTKVIIPIKPEDRWEFEDRCYQSTLFWNVRPSYGGFECIREMQEITEVKIPGDVPLRIQEHRQNKYNVDFLHGQKVGVLLDGIPYPLEAFDEFKDALLKTNMGNESVFFLVCKPGEVSLAPSRESLHYDEKTKAHLQKMIDGCMDSLMTTLLGVLSDFPRKILMYSCANTHYHQLEDNLQRLRKKAIDKGEDLTLLGIPSKETITLLNLCIRVLGLKALTEKVVPEEYREIINNLFIFSGSFLETSNGSYRYSKNLSNIGNLAFTDLVLIQDTFTMDYGRNENWVKAKMGSTMLVSTARGKKVKKEDAFKTPVAKIQEALNYLGVPSRLYSEMKPAPKKAKVVYKKIKPNAILWSDNYGQKEVLVTVEAQGMITISTKKGDFEGKYPVNRFLLVDRDTYARSNCNGLLKPIRLGRAYLGVTDIHEPFILAPEDKDLYNELRPLIPVEHASLDAAKKCLSSKAIRKQIRLLEMHNQMANSDLASFVSGIDLGRGNSLLPFVQKIRKCLNFKAPDEIIRIHKRDMLPYYNEQDSRDNPLQELENTLRNHPLGRGILNWSSYGNPEWRSQFEIFLKTFFKTHKGEKHVEANENV